MNPLQIRNTLTSIFSKRLEVKPNEERKETEDKKEMEVAVGKIEGEKAEKFIKMMKELGVD